MTGKVVGKRVDGRSHLVEIEVESVNQRGEHSTPGGGWVILPSHDTQSWVPG